MKEITNHECNNLLQDADYLQDELNALKQVISAVPYDDQPLEQESVVDMISRIGHAQTVCFIPAIRLAVRQSDNKNTKVETGYHKTYRPHDHNALPVEALIDHIIEERGTVMSLLNSVPYSEFNKPVPERSLNGKRLYDIIKEMVTYERNQLKQVAERVLSLDIGSRSETGYHRQT